MANTDKPNLPIELDDDNTEDFFKRFELQGISYNTKEFDIVYGFFKGKSFNSDAARTMSFDFLRVIKENEMDLMVMLDQLGNTDGMELNITLAAIFNKNRERTSQLGFRQVRDAVDTVERTIIS